MSAPHDPPHVSPAGALLSLHAAVALFGFAGLFGKWIDWNPVAIVLGRTLVAAAVLAAVVPMRKGRIEPPTWAVAPNGILLAVHWIAFFAAIQVSTVAIGLLGYASFPLFVPVLERVLLGLPLRPRALAGTALVALGLVLLVPDFTWASHTVRGLAWGVLSGFTFALLTVRTRKMSPTRWASEMSLWQNAIAALCVAPVVVLQGGVGGTLDVRSLALIVLLGVVCTALAHALYALCLARIGASTAAVVAALEPVYGIVLAALLLGERPDLRTMAGAALLVTAAAVASRRARVPVEA
jgi:drug/metabolite transporter (DMT)-like permease